MKDPGPQGEEGLTGQEKLRTLESPVVTSLLFTSTWYLASQLLLSVSLLPPPDAFGLFLPDIPPDLRQQLLGLNPLTRLEISRLPNEPLRHLFLPQRPLFLF